MCYNWPRAAEQSRAAEWSRRLTVLTGLVAPAPELRLKVRLRQKPKWFDP